MPRHYRGRAFAQGLEATPGTLLTLVATNANSVWFNTEITPDIPVVDRELAGQIGYHTSVPGAQAARVAAMCHFIGSGTNTAEPSWAPMLLACGLSPTAGASSVTWVPTLGNTNTVSCSQFQAGSIKKSAAGCMFSPTLNFRDAQPVEILFDGMGCWKGTASATVAPTFPATPKPPIFAGGTFTVDGNAHKISECSINFNNTIELREDVSNSTGYIAAWIVNQRITITMDPESEAAIDFYSRHTAATTGALAIVVGSAAGNTLRLGVPALQLVQAPQPGQRHNIELDMLEGIATGSNGAGLLTLSQE